MEKAIKTKENKQIQLMNLFLLCLFIMQPIMDVASYWLTEFAQSTTITLILRTFLFFATALIGFLVSKNKKLYFIFAAVLLGFWVIHYINCVRIGYSAIVIDLNNYFRTIQAPVFVLAFLSIFRFYGTEDLPIKKNFLINYGLILAVVFLALVTGTDPHTYTNTDVGVMGWFYTGNAQSAILAMVIPIVVCCAYQTDKKLIFLIACVVCYAHLFFTGTKVAFFAIFIFTGGFVLALVLLKSKEWAYYAIPIILAILCMVCYPLSPMNQRNTAYNDYVNQQQEEIDNRLESTSQQASEPVSQQASEQASQPVSQQASESVPQQENNPNSISYQEYYDLYKGMHIYAPMIERFGLETVLEHTNYTTDMQKLSNARTAKNIYNFILLSKQDRLTKMFGMHYNMELCGPKNYDSENDFLGILFLYGYVGFALYLIFTIGFIGYFIYHFIRNYKQVMSVEFICVMVGLGMALLTAIFTAGMLRRPNASFYMSVLLAYGCYLIWSAKRRKKA